MNNSEVFDLIRAGLLKAGWQHKGSMESPTTLFFMVSKGDVEARVSLVVQPPKMKSKVGDSLTQSWTMADDKGPEVYAMVALASILRDLDRVGEKKKLPLTNKNKALVVALAMFLMTASAYAVKKLIKWLGTKSDVSAQRASYAWRSIRGKRRMSDDVKRSLRSVISNLDPRESIKLRILLEKLR